MLSRFRTVTATLLAVTAVLAGPAATARADSPSAPPAAPLIGPKLPGASGSPTPSPSPTITAEEAARALFQQQAALAEEKGRLRDATQVAAALLQAYQEALRIAEAKAEAARIEAARLVQAQQRTAAAQAALQGYVGSLYRTGMIDSSMSMFATAMHANNPQQFFGGLGLAERVGAHQSDAFVAFTEAQTAQADASARSQAAAQESRIATAAAAAAKLAADRVVADFAARVALRKQAVGFTRNALANAEHREQMLARAEAIARIRSRPPEMALQGAMALRPTATCKGKNTSGYPNGRIPSDALCPLWGTYGHMLRADSAAAFNDMSREYAITFAKPICLTDSYRSYEEQEAVYKEKPELAATPGRSNHGWGLATDLCDGIQVYGSKQHQWMVDNSMRFGWFLPDWAQQTGSKPEPWHWEFAG